MSSQSSFAVIFDMDGVLVDSNPYHKRCIREFCQTHDLHLTEHDLLERVYGRTNRQWLTNLFGELPPEQLKKYADEKEAHYRRIYADDIQPVTGLIGLLDELERVKIPKAIGTSAPVENVDFTLDMTGLRKYFSIILDERFVSRGKPDPEIYLRTASALGLSPSACIVIEDSLSGLEAAQAAGSVTIAITTTHTYNEVQHANLVIRDFTELSVERLNDLMNAHG